MDAGKTGKGGRGAAGVMARWMRAFGRGRRAPPTVLTGLDGNDASGIWGVGGPAMREPGSTGIVHTLRAPGDDSGD